MALARKRWSAAKPQDRIFISYRRSDTTGFAGRLEDSLMRFFGEQRVFRDVGGITPGEDFPDKIDRSLGTTAALIVLIGPQWLVADDSGTPRLHAPGDYVAIEIRKALERDCLVIPVLVEGATMPREDQLPEGLKALSRRNAVTIDDERWNSDVTRLAKVLSFDLSGSVAERRLHILKIGILTVLSVPMAISLLYYVAGNMEIYNTWIMIINPIAIIAAGLVLAVTRSWIELSRRKYVWAAVLLAFVGLLIAWFPYLTAGRGEGGHEAQSLIAFTFTSLIMIGMLAFLAMSGFKPNEELG